MKHMPEHDGVIKFSLHHQIGGLPDWADTQALQHWFSICRQHELLGQDPTRYGGAAYGNISQRGQQGFLVTGTQTGGQRALHDEDIAWVKTWDLAANQVNSQGPVRPSSESLSHGHLYESMADVQFIIHVHHKPLWEQAVALGLLLTHPSAAYGTPAMAHEVKQLLQTPETLNAGAFGMGGHEDGLIVFGKTADQAGDRLLNLLGRLKS